MGFSVAEGYKNVRTVLDAFVSEFEVRDEPVILNTTCISMDLLFYV